MTEQYKYKQHTNGSALFTFSPLDWLKSTRNFLVFLSSEQTFQFLNNGIVQTFYSCSNNHILKSYHTFFFIFLDW